MSNEDDWMEYRHPRQRQLAREKANQNRCDCCNGGGEVGGFVNADSGYQIDVCPACHGTGRLTSALETESKT